MKIYKTNRNLLMAFLILANLVACASYRPPKPQGDWELINQKGYIPDSVPIYLEGRDVDMGYGVQPQLSDKGVDGKSENTKQPLKTKEKIGGE